MGHEDTGDDGHGTGSDRPGPAATAATATPEASAARLKERLYATITMISVVIGLAASEHVDAFGATATVLTAAVGLWLASLVADQQAHRVVHGRLATGAELRRMLWVGSPLLLSAVGPLILIGSAVLGVMELQTALYAAAGVNVASLFGWGWYGGVRMGSGPAVALLAGALDAAIGLSVALVKAAAGH
ncbi:hypothetical protein ACFZBM_21570 [Streptomyces lavendulae]|uniref:Uncharacterized protein n=1 Tax=Streptomyces lavendulae subsp. lavendulae TaxID=58340 RepID=A0A2K8PQB8_STRLA|nr:hypothetical protein [Streptomyces lavendulae]ATZ28931.1 hypothetical protein SLAV_35810 [Streptomyces lavendulae subsp. lavendulae]QUQ58756.1 hypothetical protein SLLC_33985 [Streptomyces lavendulae subsp. lavendulae]